MIERVWSDLPDFHTTLFSAGMNIVIADQAEDASETESTNGLGKTTLIRIIHFCLGSELKRDKVLSHPDLGGATFGLDFEYLGQKVTVSRNTKANGEVVEVTLPFIEDLAIDYIADDDERVTISLEDWRRVLTIKFLPDRQIKNLIDIGSPTFRELSYYFMRIGKAAFADPRQVFANQNARQKTLCVSYLLGLNWQSQKQLHEKIASRSDVSKAIKTIRSADSDGDSLGDMEAERVVLERAIGAREEEVGTFNVRDDYKEMETRLTDVDRTLHDLINTNHSDNRLLDHYQASAAELPAADEERTLAILKDAGAVFREEALKSIEEVTSFHQQVYRNRKNFLESEISAIRERIKFRTQDIRDLSGQKTEILRTLGSSGALESLIQLQRGLQDMVSQLESLKGRIEERKKFDRKKDALTTEISNIRSMLKNDLDDRTDRIDEARALFAEFTRHLYGQPAKLSIDVSSSGYDVKFTIDRPGSEGVEQMIVFCFDLMIATLRARREMPYQTLIHDSTLFADVDPRQYGLALQLASQVAEAEGFQYVCCLNSGALPHGHLGDLDLETLTRLKITDDDDRSRLLGMRLTASEAS